MRKSIGYGAYDQFGEDATETAPTSNLYTGSEPIRFARGSIEIKGRGSEGPSLKRYTFEGGLTPIGILFGCTGGGAFLYLLYKVFYKGG